MTQAGRYVREWHKRTNSIAAVMSANDPKRTLIGALPDNLCHSAHWSTSALWSVSRGLSLESAGQSLMKRAM